MSTPPPSPSPTHLILVCCHAIFNPASSREWLLAPFQTDEVPTFTAHIRAGLSLLKDDPAALLVFSGGRTRREVDRSEARGYWEWAVLQEFWGIFDSKFSLRLEEENREGTSEGMEGKNGNGDESSPGARVVLEEEALDSFGNLLRSVIKFRHTTNSWPQKITIISHAFKKPRFMHLHVPAMRFPISKVDFLGIDPGYMVEGNEEFDRGRAEEVREGERERGYGVWEGDLRGLGEVLRGKRGARDCWGSGRRLLFGGEEERVRSGIRSEVVRYGDGVVEEVLVDERQPWES